MTTSRDKGEAHTKRSLILGSVIRGQAEISEIFSFLSYYQQVCKLNKPPAPLESDEVGDSCNPGMGRDNGFLPRDTYQRGTVFAFL